MTPTNFVSGLLERPLTEAQPQTIKVGRTYQGSLSASTRVPFIRLAGRWLAEAGFSEGDEVQVSVAPGSKPSSADCPRTAPAIKNNSVTVRARSFRTFFIASTCVVGMITFIRD